MKVKIGKTETDLDKLQIPDLWQISCLKELEGYSLGGKPAADLIRETWHIANELKRMLLKGQWVKLTKRTDGMKLQWLRNQLNAAGIDNRMEGESWHAPILEVRENDLDRAWAILGPVDDVDDDDVQFIAG